MLTRSQDALCRISTARPWTGSRCSGTVAYRYKIRVESDARYCEGESLAGSEMEGGMQTMSVQFGGGLILQRRGGLLNYTYGATRISVSARGF